MLAAAGSMAGRLSRMIAGPKGSPLVSWRRLFEADFSEASHALAELTPQSRMMVLLFSDIVGSVDLRKRRGDAEAGLLISRHDQLFRQTLTAVSGAEVLKDTGDGFLARFTKVSDAVSFALRFQYALHYAEWNQRQLQVRIGLHLGEVYEMDREPGGQQKLSGLAVDMTARVMSLAAGSQILMTSAAFDNARQFLREHPTVNCDDRPQPVLKWMAHGAYLFKGSDDALGIYEVGAEGVAPLHAPADSEKARRAVKPGEEEMLGWRPGVGLEVPGRRGWVLERRLGEGGFGEVWLGTHAKTRTRRAFKFCYDYERLRSLKRELTLFRLLREVLGDRPDIARMFEVRLDQPPYFLESEFTELGNLQEWAETQGGIAALPLAMRLDLIVRTARAVAAAHSVGVLHKDIKPTNILIYLAEDGQPRPRLADFGIGVVTDASQLKSHQITGAGFTELMSSDERNRTGTRLYAPPETLVNKPYTVQGDIYSLGVLLYQLVIGDLDRPLGVGWEHDVPDPLLREDIARCVNANEAGRASSAQELVDRLESHDQRARTNRRRRIRRITALASTIAALALAVVSVVLTIQLGLVRKAEAEARKRVATSLFLADLIASPDPSKQGRYDITVLEVLDHKADLVESRFADDPESAATVRRMLGMSYKELGMYDKAEQQHRTALATRRSLHNGDHPDLAESLTDVADVLWFKNSYSQAEPMYREALAMRQRLFGSDSLEAAYTANNLAACLERSEKFAEAEALYRHVLAVRQARMQGEDRRLLAASQNNLAWCLQKQDKTDEAESLLRAALDTMIQLRGLDHYDVARLQRNLTLFLMEKSPPDLVAAEQLTLRSIETKRRTLAPDHPSLAASLHDLAQVMLMKATPSPQEESDEVLSAAERYCREALAIRAKFDDGRHPAHAATLELLSEILKAQGHAEAAEQPRQQAKAILDSIKSPAERGQ